MNAPQDLGVICLEVERDDHADRRAPPGNLGKRSSARDAEMALPGAPWATYPAMDNVKLR